jgi:hypothetical protein
MQLKEIGRIGAQFKFVNPKSITLNDISFRLKEENICDTLFGRLTSVFNSSG